MVATIFITYILIAVMNTWYLTSLLKFKKELAASGLPLNSLKRLASVSDFACLFIWWILCLP